MIPHTAGEDRMGETIEAGRDTDALVAERVMGYRWREVRLRGETNTVPVLLGPNVRDIDGLYERASLRMPRHPDYSTDIAAAWDVIDEAVRRGMGATVTTAMNWAGDPDGWNATWAGAFAHADTAPLAICRAALAAVREESRG